VTFLKVFEALGYFAIAEFLINGDTVFGFGSIFLLKGRIDLHSRRRRLNRRRKEGNIEGFLSLLKIYIRIVPHALPTKERRLYILLCYIPPASSILAFLAFLAYLFVIFENLPFQQSQGAKHNGMGCRAVRHRGGRVNFLGC
jgi:hypothetical protein